MPAISTPRIFVTGATGQLGRKVIDALLDRVPAAQVVAGVRDVAKGADLAARGVELRVADYDQPATLAAAFAGIDRLLLISGNAVGQRARQHQAVIDAAKAAGVKLIAYTSVLRADISQLGLAVEHKATENALAASGVRHVLLRNGWYLENFAGRALGGLATGAILTCAGDGKYAAATRADFAAATAIVLTSADGYAGRKLELAGSTAFTIADLAALTTRLAGRDIACQNVSPAEFEAALVKNGLPDFVAKILTNSDTSASQGWLFDDSRTLEQLLGRPTESLESVIAPAVAAVAKPAG
ncbi:MAG: Quinone oxidoreductase 2 [Pseudomonadota bacterium]|jgi:NAD(P)H dehydrogenase (quinone)